LTALDAYDNTATGYTGSQTIVFTGPATSPAPVSKAPSYPASVSFSAGLGTASPITLYDAQTTTLTATQSSITGTSTSFTVNPLSANSFSVAAPSSPIAGTAFSDNLTALDIYDNTATSYTGSKTIVFTGPSNSPAPVSQAPSYPASVSFSGGVGTASPITLYDAQTTTLTATQSSITGTSTSFTVSPSTLTSFTVPTPSTQTAGTAFNETITALDAYDNRPVAGPRAPSA